MWRNAKPETRIIFIFINLTTTLMTRRSISLFKGYFFWSDPNLIWVFPQIQVFNVRGSWSCIKRCLKMLKCLFNSPETVGWTLTQLYKTLVDLRLTPNSENTYKASNERQRIQWCCSGIFIGDFENIFADKDSYSHSGMMTNSLDEAVKNFSSFFRKVLCHK